MGSPTLRERVGLIGPWKKKKIDLSEFFSKDTLGFNIVFVGICLLTPVTFLISISLIFPGLENSLDKITDKIGDGPQRMFMTEWLMYECIYCIKEKY